MVSFFQFFPTKKKTKQLLISGQPMILRNYITSTAAKITPNISWLSPVTDNTTLLHTRTPSPQVHWGIRGDKYSCRFQLLQRSSSVCLSYRQRRCPNTEPVGGGQLCVIPGRSTSGFRPRSSCRPRCQTRHSSSEPRRASPAAAWRRTRSRLLPPEGGANTGLSVSASGEEQLDTIELKLPYYWQKMSILYSILSLLTHYLLRSKKEVSCSNVCEAWCHLILLFLKKQQTTVRVLYKWYKPIFLPFSQRSNKTLYSPLF